MARPTLSSSRADFLDGTVLDNLLRVRDGIGDDEISRVIKNSGLSKFLDETELV